MTAERDRHDPEQVVALEDVRYAPMIGGDLDSLERLFADDMAYTHSSSLFDDKAGYIQAMREAKFASTFYSESSPTLNFEIGSSTLSF
jgi:hypothetical protein